jgi:hypothetical protein
MGTHRAEKLDKGPRKGHVKKQLSEQQEPRFYNVGEKQLGKRGT